MLGSRRLKSPACNQFKQIETTDCSSIALHFSTTLPPSVELNGKLASLKPISKEGKDNVKEIAKHRTRIQTHLERVTKKQCQEAIDLFIASQLLEMQNF